MITTTDCADFTDYAVITAAKPRLIWISQIGYAQQIAALAAVI